MLERLDFWLVVITLCFLAWLESRSLRHWIVRAFQRVKGYGRERGTHVSTIPQHRPAPLGAGIGSAPLVPPQQHQETPAPVPDFEAVLDFLSKHKLTDEQAIDVLTVLQRESGHLMSANKIRDTVGGNEAQVKSRVASKRPKPPAPPRTMGRAERPANGW